MEHKNKPLQDHHYCTVDHSFDRNLFDLYHLKAWNDWGNTSVASRGRARLEINLIMIKMLRLKVISSDSPSKNYPFMAICKSIYGFMVLWVLIWGKKRKSLLWLSALYLKNFKFQKLKFDIDRILCHFHTEIWKNNFLPYFF